MVDWRQLAAMRPYVQGLPMEADGGEQRTPNSCSTDNNLTVLAHWFAELKPARTLEIGLAFGASASLLLSLHEQQGGDSEHHAIDPYQQKTWGNVALRHIEACGFSPRFHHHEELSCYALPKLAESGAKFDLIYVDGSHLFEDVFVDCYYSNLLLQPGGVIAFDDSSCAHVQKVVRFIRSNLAEWYDEQSPYLITSPSNAALKQFAARLLGKQQLTVFRKRSDTTRAWGSLFRNF